MKIPSEIMIGPFVHEISIVQKIPDGGGLGEYDYSSGRIRIRDGQKKVEMADTLLHEILHAIWHRKKLGMAHGTEEKIVNTLSTALIDTFKDNPALLKYFEKALRGKRGG